MGFSKKNIVKSTKSATEIKDTDNTFCGVVGSGDPRVFGPVTWETFHLMAQNYPNNPNLVTKNHCKKFVESIPYMLPCSQCGFHFQSFTDDYINKKGDIFQTRDSLVAFFVEAHNNVSRYTHPGKEPWTLEQAIKKYSASDTCLHSKGWGGDEICREVQCSFVGPKGGTVRGVVSNRQ
jgi:hypothetical protein